MVAKFFRNTGQSDQKDEDAAPAGTFPDCLRFQVRKEYGATTHETYTLWFAEGVGMVRSEKALVNYGAEKERVVDELK